MVRWRASSDKILQPINQLLSLMHDANGAFCPSATAKAKRPEAFPVCYRRLSFEPDADTWMIRKDETSFLVAMTLPTSRVDQCNVGMRLNDSSAITPR
jgi:hypothetical protein